MNKWSLIVGALCTLVATVTTAIVVIKERRAMKDLPTEKKGGK